MSCNKRAQAGEEGGGDGTASRRVYATAPGSSGTLQIPSAEPLADLRGTAATSPNMVHTTRLVLGEPALGFVADRPRPLSTPSNRDDRGQLICCRAYSAVHLGGAIGRALCPAWVTAALFHPVTPLLLS